jgi:succinate dehydrogenase/fumarate reductase flavoprotein subunit
VREKEVLDKLYNVNEHGFLDDYLPAGISAEECIQENLRHAPFSTRDKASRYLGIAIVKEIQAGRSTAHGGIFCDVTSVVDKIPILQERFLRSRGIDLRTAPVQIAMGHQCSNGGLRIDVRAMTSVPGVFAAGEATTGMHGADRLGGNMLLSCLIFGVRAAESAANWAKTHSVDCDLTPSAQEKLDGIRAISSASGKTSPDNLVRVLQESAWNNALTVRSEKSLTTFLSDIRQLRDEFQRSLSVQRPGNLIQALELRNLLLVGELVATTAIKREESRGGHYREDYPESAPHTPVKAILLKYSVEQGIQVREEIVDPEWKSTNQDLGKGRWG